ncbi:MAG: hypothetical protein H0T78_10595, partial [Longispora sp.]|nr:hypothetical protein [Longispora sp. (in: high G+C Gram-positive bacteria)]
MSGYNGRASVPGDSGYREPESGYRERSSGYGNQYPGAVPAAGRASVVGAAPVRIDEIAKARRVG